MEAEQALYKDVLEGLVLDEPDSGRSKRSTFSQPNLPPTPQQKKPKLSAPRMLNQSSNSVPRGGSFARAPDASSDGKNPVDSPATPVAAATAASMISQPSYLFAPIPTQPVPMLEPTHTSDTRHTVLGGQILQRPPFSFDGLTFESGADWFDPFMGFEASGSYGEGELRT
jgi:hypothetical protein